jgi:hypothetical protein
VKWTADEQVFLLRVARGVCRNGLAMRFWRTPEDVCIEVEPPYGVPVLLRVVITGPYHCQSERGSVLASSDVPVALLRLLRG